MEPCTADLLAIIYDLKEALEFDAENCDFGPAYGMWETSRKDALKRARSILKSSSYKRTTR
jgi:hypothetical protein